MYYLKSMMGICTHTLERSFFIFDFQRCISFVGISYLVVKKSLKFDLKSIFYGILIGIVNLYSSFFLLSALEKLSGALVFLQLIY